MYNNDIKNAFINERVKSVHRKASYRAMFNDIEKVERKFDKDICLMDDIELSEAMMSMPGVKTSSYKQLVSMLRMYVKWYADLTGQSASDAITRVSVNISENMKDKMVVSPLHLKRYLDLILRSPSEKSTEEPFRCYYWLAYSGCTEDEAFEIEPKHVNLRDMIIQINNCEYPIYREAVDTLRNCVELDSFYYYHPNYKEVLRSRVPGNKILRGVRSVPTKQTMRVEFSRRTSRAKSREISDLKLSYSRVRLSGMFYRIYQLELIGVEPDFSDIVEEDARKFSGKSGGISIKSFRRRKESEYRSDYESWKNIFL